MLEDLILIVTVICEGNNSLTEILVMGEWS